MITEQIKQRMRDIAARYPVQRSALLPILHIVQETDGYISDEGVAAAAEVLNLTTDDVESVATFYSMYYSEPKGKKVIKVCNSISCYLRGCDPLVEQLEQRLGIKRGETTPDGNYTLMTVECLASCTTAPALQVNGQFVENLTREKVDALLDDLDRELAGQKVPDSQAGRTR
jgi:NADH-quinone oxidoreductase E subunit